MKTIRVFATGPQADSWIERIMQTAADFNLVNILRVQKIREADYVMVFDHTVWNWLPLFLFRFLGLSNDLGQKPIFTLFRDEPKVVMPLNYGFWVWGFDLISSPGTLNKSATGFDLEWPVNPIGDFRRLKRKPRSGVCMVSANKLSLVKGELYSLRKNVATEISDVQLFGRDWSIGKSKKLVDLLKSFVIAITAGFPTTSAVQGWLLGADVSRGEVEDKLELMANYQIAVVIENSATYVSEKLFDAIASGTIPVYVGPDLSGIPELNNLCVQSDPTVEAIRESLRVAASMDLEVFQFKAGEFLDGEFYRDFSPRSVSKRFLSMLPNLN